MVSDKFLVNSETGRLAAARYATDEFATQARLDRHNALRLNLLVEETLGMVKATVDEYYGQMWFEGDENACKIHLEATSSMDIDKKHELLSVSSSGVNAAAKGFMSMIGELISRALYSYGKESTAFGLVRGETLDTPAGADIMPIWTLQAYKIELERMQNEAASKSLADLEKSIVANLADDVVVGVKGDRIELIIATSFKN